LNALPDIRERMDPHELMELMIAGSANLQCAPADFSMAIACLLQEVRRLRARNADLEFTRRVYDGDAAIVGGADERGEPRRIVPSMGVAEALHVVLDALGLLGRASDGVKPTHLR